MGLRPLLLPDEGRYGTVARDMLQQGDGLVPLLNGLPFFHKPPLMYWLDMGAMAVVGVNPFSARFGAFVGAFVMGAALFLAARRWHGPRAATAALLVLATTPFFYIAAQYDNLDMLVGGLVVATVFAMLRAVDEERPALRWVVAAWALSALAVLAKGLIGIVLPAMVVGVWLLAQRRWREVLALLHPLGIAVFALIALPWFVLMQSRYPAFYDYFIVEQHFRRYAMKSFNNVQGPWFYPVLLVIATLPWSVWLPWAVRDAASGPHRHRPHAARAVRVVDLRGAAVLQPAASKLIGYILPMLAPWCLWLADTAARRPARVAPHRRRGRRRVRGARAGARPAADPHDARRGARDGGADAAGRPGGVRRRDVLRRAVLRRLKEPPIVASRWDDPGAAPARQLAQGAVRRGPLRSGARPRAAAAARWPARARLP
jgi:4-amino-4-deoxy-L-arabinose transferase-like glycosyltransferase